MSRILFSEKQKFTQVWLILIIGATNLIVAVIMVSSIYSQFIVGEPWGNKPMSDTGLIIFWGCLLLGMILVNIIIFGAKLEIEVKDNSVYYKYFPFVWNWKYIHKDNINSYEMKRLNALKDFGGYGYRKNFFKNSTGLIVKGQYGLELTLHDGHTWLIGTQKPEALKKAMSEIMDRKIDY